MGCKLEVRDVSRKKDQGEGISALASPEDNSVLNINSRSESESIT